MNFQKLVLFPGASTLEIFECTLKLRSSNTRLRSVQAFSAASLACGSPFQKLLDLVKSSVLHLKYYTTITCKSWESRKPYPFLSNVVMYTASRQRNGDLSSFSELSTEQTGWKINKIWSTFALPRLNDS